MAARQRAGRPPGTRTAIYTRISRDAEGLALGVDRQREDLDEFAVRHGLKVVARFEDNDTGASTRSRKPRPEYKAMLAAAACSQFDVVLAYTSSRLTRRPRENEDLIELAERHGVRFLYRNSPSFDLNTADGRNVARILAANDAAEAERIGERVAREAKQRAEHGKWHGGWPPCGYRFTYDGGEPPSVTGLAVDHERAEILREMARRVIEGETLYSLCRDLNRRGLTTPPGAKAKDGAMWRSRTLKRALINPAVIGMREHDGELYPGEWPAILDRQTWDRVRDVLLDPDRTDPDRSWMTDVSRKRALSGLLKCGGTRDDGTPCGATLVSQSMSRRDGEKVVTMVCSSQATGGCGHLRINYDPVEQWVTRLLVARLDSDEMRAALAAKDNDTTEDEATLRRDIATDAKRLQRLTDRWTDMDLTDAEYRRQRDRLTARMDDARRRLAKIAGERVTGDLTTGADLVARLAAATVEQQRAILSSFIDKVVIGPQPKGVPTHVTRRKTESAEDYRKRLDDLRESTLSRRLAIKWKPVGRGR